MSHIFDRVREDLIVVHTDVDHDAISRHLDASPIDNHYPGINRFRSMSRFRVEDDRNVLLERAPLFQSESVNAVKDYGGKSRDYVDLPQDLREEEAFDTVMGLWRDAVGEPVAKFSCHHIRTVAPGEPVPEGRHRDGYEWVGVYIAQRRGITPQSGVTKFWDRRTGAVLFDSPLSEGDLVVFNDRNFLHTATKIEASGVGIGVRDVFIITLPDHGVIRSAVDEIG